MEGPRLAEYMNVNLFGPHIDHLLKVRSKDLNVTQDALQGILKMLLQSTRNSCLAFLAKVFPLLLQKMKQPVYLR